MRAANVREANEMITEAVTAFLIFLLLLYAENGRVVQQLG